MGLGAVWIGGGSGKDRDGRSDAAQGRRIAADDQNLPATAEASSPKSVAPRAVTSLFASEVEPDAGEIFSAPVVSLPPALPPDQRQALLQAMDRDEVSVCTKCALCQSRTHTVFGEGDCEAPLLFIGEGPGENEDHTGRPFVGRAGQLLDKMIAAMGLRREQVYIANIVKCRPPGNRVPAPEEVAACAPYLVRQIEIIQPRVIVTLGLPASRYLLQVARSMGQMRGNWHAWNGIPVMPTYHPAYILRSYNEQTRAAVWSDLRQVMTKLGLARKS
jgi:DNA polymerase